jgi:hypothetical protein
MRLRRIPPNEGLGPGMQSFLDASRSQNVPFIDILEGHQLYIATYDLRVGYRTMGISQFGRTSDRIDEITQEPSVLDATGRDFEQPFEESPPVGVIYVARHDGQTAGSEFLADEDTYRSRMTRIPRVTVRSEYRSAVPSTV